MRVNIFDRLRCERLHIQGNYLADGVVYLNGEYLSPEGSQIVCNHSPDGFAWGYQGSGPAQLALAILLEYVDKETALRYYQDFKREYIARLPADEPFEITINLYKWIMRKINTE